MRNDLVGLNCEQLAFWRALSTLSPQVTRDGKWIETAIMPPASFVAGRVVFAVVQGTKGNGELIADLQASPSRLCKPDMMGLRGRPVANHAGLRRHKF